MYQRIQKVLVHEFVQDGNGETAMQEKVINEPVPTIKTPFNSKFFPKNQEINDEASMTIPDQAMTVQEIMTRFAQGLPMDGGRTPVWQQEDDMPDISKLDLADRQAIIEAAEEEIKKIQERVKERRKAVEQHNLDKIVKERMEQRAKEAQEKASQGDDKKPI